MSKNAMVAMSGGVDSSVAAALLKEQGFEVSGATFKLFSNEDIGLPKLSRTCCSLDDVEDARRVAYKIGIEHFVLNFGEQFFESVIMRFAESYAKGETPNPCIDCNRYIKFEKFLGRASQLGFNYIATGHYARIEYDDSRGRYLLKKAKDTSKDQTYVLYSMTQEQLKRTLFPLGNLKKSEVRAFAQERDLINAKKPDSQDICFVPDGDYAAFLENVLHMKAAPGQFIDCEGNVLGTHKGLIHYTVGQRRGIDLSFDRRKYVICKDAQNNTVTLGDECLLYSEDMAVTDCNLISLERLVKPMDATVKTRYSQTEASATLYPSDNGNIYIQFRSPQRAVTPGQAAVFYDGDIVIGGGTII